MFVAGEGRGGERVTKREGDPERDPLQRYFSPEMLGLAGVSQTISLLTAMRPSQSSTAFFAVTPASRPSTPTAAVRGIWPSLGLGGASVAYGALAARGDWRAIVLASHRVLALPGSWTTMFSKNRVILTVSSIATNARTASAGSIRNRRIEPSARRALPSTMAAVNKSLAWTNKS